VAEPQKSLATMPCTLAGMRPPYLHCLRRTRWRLRRAAAKSKPLYFLYTYMYLCMYVHLTQEQIVTFCFHQASYVKQRDHIGRIFSLGRLFTLGSLHWAHFGQFTLFTLGSCFFLNTEVAQFFVDTTYILSTVNLCNNFDKNGFGPHFRRFFHELIWSPWMQANDAA
jgi:hypothetical protein